MMTDTYCAVMPLVVAHLADGSMGYFHAGEPLVGVPEQEVQRLAEKGAVAKDVVADGEQVVKTAVRRTAK